MRFASSFALASVANAITLEAFLKVLHPHPEPSVDDPAADYNYNMNGADWADAYEICGTGT